MPQPTTTLETARPDLAGGFEEFDLAMRELGFVGLRVLPVFEVDESFGMFTRLPLKQLLQERETLRAPGTGYTRGKYKFVKDSFATDDHGAEEVIDKREAKMYRNFFDIEQISADRAFDAVLGAAEKRIADAVFNTTTWNGAALTTAVAAKWDLPATKVIKDVDNARQKMWDGTGIWPNSLIINRIVFHDLRNNTEIIDRVASAGAGSSTLEADMTIQQMARVFDLENIVVADSARNAANEGQDVSIAPVWSSTMAMVCRIDTGNDLRKPGLGRTFHWGEDGSLIGGFVETYYEPQNRSDIVRVRHDVDEKILYPAAGHLLTAVK